MTEDTIINGCSIGFYICSNFFLPGLNVGELRECFIDFSATFSPSVRARYSREYETLSSKDKSDLIEYAAREMVGV